MQGMKKLDTKKDFKYIEIYNKLKNKIENKLWDKGTKLPPEYKLTNQYSVSRDTIRKSLQKLEHEGYIYRQAGKGTFVNNLTKSHYKLTRLESFSEQMLDMNLEPSSKLLDTSLIVPKQKIKENLQLLNNEQIYKIERLRLADNKPMCYEIAYISKSLCPNIDELVKNNTSLYELYEGYYNLNLEYGNIFLESQNCPKEYTKELKINEHTPVLKMRCIVYVEGKKPLYFVESYYRGDKYVFFASMPRI